MLAFRICKLIGQITAGLGTLFIRFRFKKASSAAIASAVWRDIIQELNEDLGGGGDDLQMGTLS